MKTVDPALTPLRDPPSRDWFTEVELYVPVGFVPVKELPDVFCVIVVPLLV